jgi:putative flavoprotein involved in K+ transport
MNAVGVAVIGAGAAGLGVAAELRRRGVEGVVVLERSDRVAESWRNRYDGLRLNTTRLLSGVPRRRIPARSGSWPSREDFVGYLEDVAAGEQLEIRYRVEVRRICRDAEGWLLETSAGFVPAASVVVATGYDAAAHVPDWPGRAGFTGELLHATRFRTAAAFRGRDVLVVGAGNTGTEIATRLADDRAARVRVSFRTPVNIMPARVLGIPATVLARLNEGAPDWLVDRSAFAIQRLAWGDLAPHGMPRAPHGVATELRVRGLGATLDRGFVAALKARRLELVPAVERFDGQDVVLATGERVRPQVVIAATGYRHGLEPLAGHLGVLTPTGRPAVRTGNAHPDAPGLYFNGFWLPLSGQLPAMRRTSRRIARAIAKERRAREAERPRVRGLSRFSSLAAGR